MNASAVDARSLLVLLGPPGAGKSTLVETILSAVPGLAHFAVRRQFLEEKKKRSDLWLAAAESQEKRQWLPDEVVIAAFTRRLDAQFPGGMLIEGLPASARQAQLVIKSLATRDRHIAAVIYLDAPDQVCMERMRKRSVCVTCDGGISQAAIAESDSDRCARCGSLLGRRWDDEEEPFAERLRVHREHIEGILKEFGPDRLIVLDGARTRAEVAKAACRQLGLHPRP
ncbi:adenylate kinase family protein [Nonomuraea sp. NPDC051941]|uniref:adenylate kinase family protein n=1 Tax=Nonomuraea sp. NPDC051941 TaxID=3364373 RepID=UPI0037CA6D8B